MPTCLVRVALAGLARLPSGSRLRERVFKRAFVRGLEGLGRDDDQFALLFYEPTVDTQMVGEVARISAWLSTTTATRCDRARVCAVVG